MRRRSGLRIWVLLLLLAGSADLYLMHYAGEEQVRWRQISERSVLQVAQLVAQHFRASRSLDEGLFQKIFSTDPQIAYVVVDDRLGGVRGGGISPSAMLGAPPQVSERAMRQDFNQLANELVQPGKGGAAIGFDVLQVELIDERTPHAAPQAMLKMGYVIPDFFALQRLIWGLDGVLVILVFGAAVSAIRSRTRKRTTRRFPGPRLIVGGKASRTLPGSDEALLVGEKEEVDLFAIGSVADSDATEIVSLSQPQHLLGEKWIPMLDDGGLTSWQRRGDWFLVNDFLFVNPWRASIVRTDFSFRDYIYRVKAKSIAGADGFTILFTVDGKSLVWVLGGWNNRRCEVAGIAETRVDAQLDRDRWYELTVEVLRDTVNGYLNGDKQWSLKREAIVAGDYSGDFLPGIGVGSWSSVCKFKDPMIVDKSGEDDGDKTEI